MLSNSILILLMSLYYVFLDTWMKSGKVSLLALVDCDTRRMKKYFKYIYRLAAIGVLILNSSTFVNALLFEVQLILLVHIVQNLNFFFSEVPVEKQQFIHHHGGKGLFQSLHIVSSKNHNT